MHSNQSLCGSSVYIHYNKIPFAISLCWYKRLQEHDNENNSKTNNVHGRCLMCLFSIILQSINVSIHPIHHVWNISNTWNFYWIFGYVTNVSLERTVRAKVYFSQLNCKSVSSKLRNLRPCSRTNYTFSLSVWLICVNICRWQNVFK